MQKNKDRSSNAELEPRSHIDCLSKVVVFVFCILILTILVILVVKKHSNAPLAEKIISPIKFASKNTRVQVFDDIKINIDILNEKGQDYLQSASYNDNIANFLKKNIQEGDTIVEVNNEIGMQTLLSLKLCGTSGRVYSFNPNKEYILPLNYLAKSNFLSSRLRLKNIAISDHAFDGKIISSKNITESKIVEANDEVLEKINVSYLDKEVYNLQNVNFIKLNVAPLDALKIIAGAKKLIESSLYAYIIFNYDSTCYAELQETLSKLAGKFQTYLILSDGNIKELENNDLLELKNLQIAIKSDS